MKNGKYRILQREYEDGYTRYILEKEDTALGVWNSVFSSDDLEVIKEAKATRERRESIKNEKVIE